MKGKEIIIRKTEESDHSEIAQLSIQVWQESYKDILEKKFLDSLSYEERLHGRYHWFSAPNKFSIVAIMENKIIGFCDFGVSRQPDISKGEIYAIYLLAEYQRQGIGLLLITKAMQKLQEHHLTPYSVVTLEKNVQAQNFYKKSGFFSVGKIMSNIGGREYEEKIFLHNNQ